jgi:hypothetical protein
MSMSISREPLLINADPGLKIYREICASPSRNIPPSLVLAGQARIACMHTSERVLIILAEKDGGREGGSHSADPFMARSYFAGRSKN